MARTVSLNKRFNRGVPARAYIKHLHVYTEGEITEKEYLNAFCREIIPVHPEFRLSIKPSKGKSSPRKILDAMRRDAKLFGDKRSNEIWVLIDQDDWPASHVEELKEGKGIRQAVSIYKVLQ
ncbi:MAG: RloB domain-containing protein, partial [Sutterella wadsworthensis]